MWLCWLVGLVFPALLMQTVFPLLQVYDIVLVRYLQTSLGNVAEYSWNDIAGSSPGWLCYCPGRQKDSSALALPLPVSTSKTQAKIHIYS